MRHQVATLGLFFVIASVMSAQSRGPSSLWSTADSATQAAYRTLYVDRPPFVIGWNWAPAMLRTNTDLHTNIVHADYPFAWKAPLPRSPQMSIESYPPGTALILCPFWFLPDSIVEQRLPWFQRLAMMDRTDLKVDLGKGARPSLLEAMGMRFDMTKAHPERSHKDSLVPWGFRSIDSTAGTFVSHDDGRSTSFQLKRISDRPSHWHTVLNDSWPADKFGAWLADEHLQQMSPFNGRRMYLAVNVRRLATSGNAVDDTPILKLRIHYTTCDVKKGRRLIHFDSVPARAGIPYTLPRTLAGLHRGYAYPLERHRSADSVTEVVITRRMLPLLTSPLDLDVTVMAHFIAAPAPFQGVSDMDANAFLRGRWYLGKPFSEREVSEGRIDSMWVEVQFNGSTDVSVNWVQIGTENMTWMTQGYHDEIVSQGYADMAKGMMAYNNDRFGDDTVSWIRIWRWYNRDEAPEAWWQGVKYFNDLFDDRTNFEVGSTFDQQYMYHLTGVHELWEGETPKITPSVQAPYFDHGHLGVTKHVQRSLGYRCGYRDRHWEGNLAIDYDTDPYFGLQVFFDVERERLRERSWYLFDQKHDWISNIWLSGDYSLHDDNSMIRLVGYTPRPLTGEEVSLVIWSQVILGAKGLAYWWGPGPDSLTHMEHYRRTGYIVPGIAYGPVQRTFTRFIRDDNGRLREDRINRPSAVADSRTVFLHRQAARSAYAGPDWLDSANSTGLFQILQEQNATPLSEALAYMNSESHKPFYLGWQSNRSALQEVGTVLHSCAQDLSRLHLRAWFMKGNSMFLEGAEGDFANVLDVSRLRTRHPLDSLPTGWESFDSMYVELTLLSIGDVSMDSSFAIGVLNRRADPAIPVQTDGVNGEHPFEFTSFEDHRKRRETNPEDAVIFLQRGSRIVDIPFAVFDNRQQPVMLRVRSLGSSVIDVIQAGNAHLPVKLLPGQGMLLRVDIVR